MAGSAASAASRQKDAVHALIDAKRPDIERFLAEYVQHRSIDPARELPEVERGGTDQCQEWLYGRLTELGTFEDVEMLGGSEEHIVAARLPACGASDFRSVTFTGHTDVVPVTSEEYEQWRGGDPWSGAIADGVLYGRGAADMKGGSTAAIWAAHCLAAAGVRLDGQCALAFTVGEESGRKEIGPLALLREGYGADVIIIPEPTGLDVCPAAVGWFFFRVEVKGEATHAAGRVTSIHPTSAGVQGVNAIDVMTRVLARLRELEAQWGLHERHPLMVPGTMAINPVHIGGGALQATTPEYCVADFAVVISPNRTSADAIAEIRAAVSSITIGDPWLTAHPPVVTAPFLQDAYEPVVSAEDPTARDLLLQARRVDRRQSQFAALPTPSDANFFSEEGQQVLVCGPSRLVGDGVHGLNERVAIDDVVDLAKSFASFAIDWCSLTRT